MQKFCVEGHQERVHCFGSRDGNQVWGTEDVVKVVGKKEVWNRIEKIKDRGAQMDVGLLHLYAVWAK